MHVVECDQGSAKWFTARCGIPTASNMKNIVTSRGIASTSTSRTTYMHTLIHERLTGNQVDTFCNKAMERGNTLEPIARGFFEMEKGFEVKEVGFCLSDCGRWGVSPDGLINADSGIEIKTHPSAHASHIANLLTGKTPSSFMVQIQACMWVCERSSWWYVLYTEDEGVPSMILKVERDEKICDCLAVELPKFCAELDAKEAAIRARYDLPEREAVDLSQIGGGACPWSEESEPYDSKGNLKQ